MLLSINDLSLQFQTEAAVTDAVRNISLQVERGEIVAIVGESGSGKSVTALSILQLLPTASARYTSGEILFSPHGERPVDLLKLDPAELRQLRGKEISMIFQEPMTSLNPVFTCGNQVMEAIQLHEKANRPNARQRVLELFEQVKLPNPQMMFNRYPHQLSGGQKQRVMIAMAMSCNPSLLICDEPTTALDVTVQKNILQLIRELQESNNMGVIFITHDLGVVGEIADRAIVMYKGSIVEQGRTTEIFSAPQHPYTKALLACRPVLHPKGERLPTVSDFMDTVGGEVPLPGIVTPLATANLAVVSDGNVKNELIRVEHLSVLFPANRSFFGKPKAFIKAVDDVSFTVYKGETLGLVGESGCGKTTLGRALLRLIEPTTGKVIYNGVDMSTLRGSRLRVFRKDIQIVFQDPYSSLNPRITVGNAIAEPLRVHGLVKGRSAQKDRVMELLEKVSLRPEHFNRYPHEFSGGQRQRIVIARALALNPSFVVCDESVSALDVSVQAQVLNLLNDLKSSFGFTVIFISHDLSVVHYLSDRIMVMNKGRIEETGTAEQVYHRQASDYTKRLIAAIPGRQRVVPGSN